MGSLFVQKKKKSKLPDANMAPPEILLMPREELSVVKKATKELRKNKTLTTRRHLPKIVFSTPLFLSDINENC